MKTNEFELNVMNLGAKVPTAKIRAGGLCATPICGTKSNALKKNYWERESMHGGQLNRNITTGRPRRPGLSTEQKNSFEASPRKGMSMVLESLGETQTRGPISC